MTPAKVLTAVADAYESGEIWWVPFFPGLARDSGVVVDRRCCDIVDGVIRVHSAQTGQDAVDLFARHVGMLASTWNDDHCQSTAHAIATLRAAAGITNHARE